MSREQQCIDIEIWCTPKNLTLWSTRLKSSNQSINCVNKNYLPTYTCVCVCVCVCVWREREREMLTNSICNVEDVLETLQNCATLSVRPAVRKVLNGVDKRRMSPYKRLFLRHSCLMPGHTPSPLPP